jgi:cysteine-rich repeat protein
MSRLSFQTRSLFACALAFSLAGCPESGGGSGDGAGGGGGNGEPVGGEQVDSGFGGGVLPVGGEPVGGAPVGGAPVGGAPVGGAPVGGAPVGGEPVGGAPVGGEPVGGEPVGGAPVGGVPVGGEPVGGEPPPACVDGETMGCEFEGCRGTTTCDAGEWTACQGPAETCNAADDDCDGLVDEDFAELGAQCADGEGVCGGEGVWICDGQGGVQCAVQPGLPPSDEVCDALDNDCNGLVDDVDPAACYTGPANTEGVGECRGGLADCVQGAPGACLGETLPAVETCDALDNDCDGAADEDFDDQNGEGPRIGFGCSVGIGACAAQGVWQCNVEGDGVECSAPAIAPAAEVCDRIDNDCDGAIDEDGVCEPVVGGAHVMRCGTSDRDVSTFLLPEDRLGIVEGCSPNRDTVALLVSRTGQPDAQATVAWLQAGGNLLTEYSVALSVYNGLFGTNLVPGAFFGSCNDTVNPPSRSNPDDPFWRSLPNLPLGAGQMGCGQALDNLPRGAVRLGGPDANTTALAYQDVGEGRFWFVEVDWQDRDTVGAEYADSNTLMRAMILWGAGPELVGSFLVSDGPYWADSVAVSCVAACAQLFGGQAADYACSTVEGFANGRAFVDGWADEQYCAGEGVADDFVLPGEGLPYDCGQRGCAYSAYVNDHACAGRNYCFREPSVALNPAQGFGAHGGCDSWNVCNDAETCANAACQNAGYARAVSWQEGLCEDLRAAIPGFTCSLFFELPNNLDVGWGGGCNIPVAYEIRCDGVGPPPDVCGDGDVTGNEECDDGGTEDADGCSATCTTENFLGATRGFGHHGECTGWNDCVDGETCATAACELLGFGPALLWSEGNYEALRVEFPGFDGDLFFSTAPPANLDATWSETYGDSPCDLNLAYAIVCDDPLVIIDGPR